MPTYEYACRECGQHLEVVQSFRDEPLTICPHCGGALRKVYGAAGIIFKGSGYYVNDSRRKPAAAQSDSDAGTSKEAATTSGESKGGDSSGAAGSGSDKAADTTAKSA